MLVALNQTKKYVIADKAKKSDQYKCPVCNEKVILKRGIKIISHFAHLAHANCIGGEGETQIHLRGKKQLFNDLKIKYPQITLEKYLPELKQRPDLMVKNLAIEYQCSPISNQRLEERVLGYKSKKINSIWILGMKYFAQNLRAYSVLRFIRYHNEIGYYLLFLDPIQQRYYLKYHIVQQQDKITFKLKNFNSYSLLTDFMSKFHTFSKGNNSSLIETIKLIENKIRRKEPQMLLIQQLCYENRHLITGCPLITHFPMINVPMLNQNWLLWKIKIILFLENRGKCTLKDLNELLEINKYLFIKNVNPIIPYLKILQKAGFVLIFQQNIFLIRKFTWYQDTYDKIDAIKTLEKRQYFDN